jgi:hypothetical protein
LREKGREFALDFPVAVILANMKKKSQETISLLNPHNTYLNVSTLFPNRSCCIVEEETACRLDKWSGREPLDCLGNDPSLCADDGPVHIDPA